MPARTGLRVSLKAASPSTEEDTISQQLGARGNDRDQHQLFECLRCNFIAHMLSDLGSGGMKVERRFGKMVE
jgi:hypothetical protein